MASPSGISILGHELVPSADAAGSGLSTLAGSGLTGMANGSSGAASFDTLGDMVMSPDGAALYVIDVATDLTRTTAIRRVDTATGAVSTYSSGGLLVAPSGLAIDPAGTLYVAVAKAGTTWGGAVIRIPAGGGSQSVVTAEASVGFGGSDVAVSPDGSQLYFVGQTTSSENPSGVPVNEMRLKQVGVGGGTSVDLDGPGRWDRENVPSMYFAGDANLYLSWAKGSCSGNIYGTCDTLVRLVGINNFAEIRAPFEAQKSGVFAPGSSTLYTTCDTVAGFGFDNNCDGASSVVRRLNFGADLPTTMVGGIPGFADGDPGQMSNPRGLAIGPDRQTLFIADRNNHRIRKEILPPDPNALSDLERACGCNPAVPGLADNFATAGDPVDTYNGSFFERFQDLVVPGRGNGLELVRSYNSKVASVDGPLGYGWTHGTGAKLLIAGTGNVTVQQESGAQVSFALSGGVYSAPPRVDATLAKAGSGASAVYTFTRRGNEVFVFNSTGRLTSVTDRNGYANTYAYSGSNLSTVTDSAGRALTYTWVGSRITKVTDPAGRHVDYSYDGSGNLSGVTDVAGNTWAFGYDGAHRLTTVRDPRQAGAGSPKLITNVYDGFGRVISQTDRLNRTTLLDYTAVANGTKVTDPKGNVRVDRYLDGRRTSVTVGDVPGAANTSTWTFETDLETFGITKVTDPNGQVSATVTYDARGNVLTAKDALGRFTAQVSGYNQWNAPLDSKDNANVTTTFTYDGRGNLASSSTPFSPNPQTITYSHADAAHPGDVTSVVDPLSKSSVFGYDANGYRTASTDPLGNKTTWVYDNVGRLQSSVTPKGNKAGGVPANFRTTYVTNAYGDVTTVTDPLGHGTSRILDADRNVTSVTDANNHVTGYVFDDMNQLTQVNRPGTTPIKNTYWPDGTLNTQVDGANAATTYTYDTRGRLASVSDPKSRITAYGYDGAGNLTSKADPGGSCPGAGCTSFGYNAADQLTSTTFSDGVTPNVTAVTFDALGRAATMVTSVGTSSWGYDSLGRLTSSATPSGGSVGYGYNLRNDQTTVTYAAGKTLTRRFDDAGRVDQITDWNAKVTAFHPDENSNYDTITFPTATGNIDTFTFDNADRLMSQAFKKNAGATTTVTLAYGRLNANQLSGVNQSGLPGNLTETYAYDNIDQLTGVTASTTKTFNYDTADNLTKLQDGTTQAFDAANQLCYTAPSGAPAGTCAAPPSAATSFGFDTRGNRITVTPPASANIPASAFGYDQANRLVSATAQTLAGNAGQFTPVPSTRVFSSTASTGTVSVQLTGVGGIPATGVAAVTFTLTAVNAAGTGAATVYRSDTTLPVTSNLNYDATHNVSNMVVSKVGADGKVKITVTAAADLWVDVQGWYSTPAGAAGGVFTALDPTRIVDTRAATQMGTCTPSCSTMAANSTITVQVAGRGGVPATGVGEVAVNVTTQNTTATGTLIVYPADTTQPGVPSVTHTGTGAGSGLTFVKLSPDGKIKITAAFASADVLVDVEGWVSTGAGPGDSYVPLDPARVLSTTAPVTGTCTPACARLAANTTTSVQIAGSGGVPTAGGRSVMVNMTVVNPGGNGLIEAYSSDAAQPTGLDLVYNTGQTTAIAAVVKLGADGRIKILNAFAATDLRIDVVGYYTPATDTTTYKYGADGLRDSKTTSNATKTSFIWDRSGGLPMLLAEKNGTTNGVTYYLYAPDGLPYAQINADGSTWYLHHDQLGSTRTITNNTGATIATFTYDPYGKITGTTGTATTRLAYTGQYLDDETGFYYLRARYYDPTTAQFLTKDPLAHQTRSAYAYVHQSPLNRVDPSGLCDPVTWVSSKSELGVGPTSCERQDAQLGNSPAATSISGATGLMDQVEQKVNDYQPTAGVCAGGRGTAVLSMSGQVCAAVDMQGFFVTGTSGKGGAISNSPLGGGLSCLLGLGGRNGLSDGGMEYGGSAGTWSASFSRSTSGTGYFLSLGRSTPGAEVHGESTFTWIWELNGT